MEQKLNSLLSRRISRLRWQVPLLALLLVLLHQWIEHAWLFYLPRWKHFVTQVAFYGLVGPVLAWMALTSLRKRVEETEKAERALREAHQDLNAAKHRLELILETSRRLAEATDEDDLVESILEITLDLVPALGCSLIRYDEHERPLPPAHSGALSKEAFEAWSAHLSTAGINKQCRDCESHLAVDTDSCSLFDAIPESDAGRKMYCLELERGERKFGMLNIYFEDPNHPNPWERSLLANVANEISLALENIHWRNRELATLYQIQQSRQLNNLHQELEDVLSHVAASLEVDGGALFLVDEEEEDLRLLAQIGSVEEDKLSMIRGLALGAFQAQSQFVINELEQEEMGMDSLLFAPMEGDNDLLGCIVLWSDSRNKFTRRRARLVETVAGQAALLVENHRLYLQAEQQAALTERARLAREIHDGLAQTLGYLKLRSSQILKWLKAGDAERGAAALEGVRELINESYIDTREAIQGLRLKPEGSFQQWLSQIGDHFEKLSGIKLEMTVPSDLELTSEVQVQLIRIVQEGLSNIRKHADATQARVVCRVGDHWLTIRIIDNGQGFNPADVPDVSRHGLRIMRERSELLDADFQIASEPDGGTELVIRMPLHPLNLAEEGRADESGVMGEVWER